MLKIKVADLTDEPLVLDLDLDPEALELEDDLFTFKGRVKGQLEFKLIGHDVEGRGALDVEAEADCGRCLARVPIHVHVPIDEMWLLRTEAADDAADRLDSETSLAEYYDGDEIILDEPLRELILADLPFHVLCKEDCKGLCPGCGVDRNTETCRCKPQEAETPAPPEEAPWKQALRALKKDA